MSRGEAEGMRTVGEPVRLGSLTSAAPPPPHPTLSKAAIDNELMLAFITVNIDE